jgi:hypothetical protein
VLQPSRRDFVKRGLVQSGLKGKRHKPIVCSTPSEAKPRLQIDHAPGKTTLGLPKQRVAGYTVVADDIAGRRVAKAAASVVETLEIEFIENVEEIRAKLEPGVSLQE